MALSDGANDMDGKLEDEQVASVGERADVENGVAT